MNLGSPRNRTVCLLALAVVALGGGCSSGGANSSHAKPSASPEWTALDFCNAGDPLIEQIRSTLTDAMQGNGGVPNLGLNADVGHEIGQPISDVQAVADHQGDYDIRTMLQEYATDARKLHDILVGGSTDPLTEAFRTDGAGQKVLDKCKSVQAASSDPLSSPS